MIPIAEETAFPLLPLYLTGLMKFSYPPKWKGSGWIRAVWVFFKIKPKSKVEDEKIHCLYRRIWSIPRQE